VISLLLATALALQTATNSPQKTPAKAAPTSQSDDVIPAVPPMEPMPPLAPGAKVVASSPTKPAAAPAPVNAPTQVDRTNLTITAWELELLVRPVTGTIAARAHVTVRNDAATSRTILPLQISSTLQWQAISTRGAKVAFESHSLDTDLDHTGTANEAVVSLPSPLAAGQSITLDALYEGTVPLDATRIEHLGAPRDIAQRTDWDRIAGDFTGLRGFGTVLWYPVIADPVTLGDGAKIFHVIGQWKQQEQTATMRIRLRVDATTDLDQPVRPAGPQSVQPRTTPRVAILNGERFRLVPSTPDDNPDIVEAELPTTPVGFAVPSLFLLSQDEIAQPGLLMFPRDTNSNAAPGFATALEQVRPLVSQWLGAQKRDLAVVDTPSLQDSPFETQPWPVAANGDPLLVTPMLAQDPQQNTLAMAHALAHASFLSRRAWLSEGVAQFLSSLWIGKTGDPTAALGALEVQRPALALAETPDPGADPGQPLIAATDDIYLRTKSAYVLWMLREIAGDEALTQALHDYNSVADTQPEYFQRLVESASHKDLQWFFDDWVYRDRGLPDLHITNVVSHRIDTAAPSWLVSVDIANQGYAVAEVPVVIHAGDASESQRARVPGRGTITVRAVLHTQPTSVTVNNGATPEVNASVHQFEIQPPPAASDSGH
jgi:hypothetical protein